MKPIVRTHLVEARQQRHWSQQEVADFLGTTQNNVSRWERGITTPNPYFRSKLCQLFGKSVEDLGFVTREALPPSPEDQRKENNISPDLPLIWTIPYLRNPYFTGRDEIFKQLDSLFSHTELDEQKTMRRAALTQTKAIKGLGGIGKTQIAVEYAYRAHEQGHFTHTIWINAANKEAIITSFVPLAEQLPDSHIKNETSKRKLLAAIIHWLEQCPDRWLLIFDNADDPTLLHEYLPQRGKGSILLTTRANAVGSIATSIEVEKIGFVEGIHLLLRRAQRLEQASDEEMNEAGNLVIALDQFPLALDQAGAYIEETGCSLHDYLLFYQNHRKTLLARRGTQVSNYPDSVATTWSLSFQKVEQANPAAAELLKLYAFLAPDTIPEEMLIQGTTYWPPLLQRAATDSLLVNQMIEDVLRFSLVKRLTADHLLSMHRLVQIVIVDAMDTSEQRIWARRVIQATHKIFPQRVEATTWSLCQRYLPQAQQCVLWIQEYEYVFEEAAALLFRTANYLYEQALYTQAELLFQQALNMWEHLFGPDHPDVASSLYCLAIVYSQQRKYEQALLFQQRALHIRKQVLGPDHPDVAASLYRLAIVYGLQEKGEQAEPLFLQALHIWEQKQGSDHLDIAGVLDGLAIIYAQQKKNKQAEPLFKRALHIREQVLGQNHPNIAASLSNLAEFTLSQGKHEQVELLCGRAIDIWEQTLGYNHPYLAYPLGVLATLYTKQEKYTQSESLYQRVLDIQEQAFGDDHPEIADTLYDFAALREIQGKYQEAASFYQRVLAIQGQIFGQQHAKVIEIRERLHTVLSVMNNKRAR